MNGIKAILVFGLTFSIFSLLSATSATGQTDDGSLVAMADTGQTVSYTETFGEDSSYSINPPSFSDNGDGTVSDNVTGNMWQREDDDTTRTWDDASSYCGDLELGGFTDWQLPDTFELMGIVNNGRFRPSIDTAFFPNTNPSEYWSSDNDAKYESLAWNVNFNYGELFHYNKSSKYFVRCIRGNNTKVSATKTYSTDSSGTVTDDSTGLTWEVAGGRPRRGMNWESAINYCENLSLAEKDDWRLPNYKEMGSLLDYDKFNPALDNRYFPDVVPSSYTGYYWTSTTHVSNRFHAWIVHFAFGQVNFCNKDTRFLVRCVRGEKK